MPIKFVHSISFSVADAFPVPMLASGTIMRSRSSEHIHEFKHWMPAAAELVCDMIYG